MKIGSPFTAEFMIVYYDYETEVSSKCGTGPGKIQDICPPTLPGISRISEKVKAEAFHHVEIIKKLEKEPGNGAEIVLRKQAINDIFAI